MDGCNIAPRWPVGVGPVLSQWDKGDPCYVFRAVFQDGSTTLYRFPKSRDGADRAAKLAAIRARISLANDTRARDGLVLTHDESSFTGLVALIGALTGAATAEA